MKRFTAGALALGLAATLMLPTAAASSIHKKVSAYVLNTSIRKNASSARNNRDTKLSIGKCEKNHLNTPTKKGIAFIIATPKPKAILKPSAAFTNGSRHAAVTVNGRK